MSRDKDITITNSTLTYKVVPDFLLRKHCADLAVIYSYLESQHRAFEKRGTLVDGKFFYRTYENIASRCYMSVDKVKKHVKTMEKEGYIETKFLYSGGKNTKHYCVDVCVLEKKSRDSEWEAESDVEKRMVKRRRQFVKDSAKKRKLKNHSSQEQDSDSRKESNGSETDNPVNYIFPDIGEFDFKKYKSNLGLK